MAEGGGLEPPSPKAPVFKTGALPITLTLRRKWTRQNGDVKTAILYWTRLPISMPRPAFRHLLGEVEDGAGVVLRDCAGVEAELSEVLEACAFSFSFTDSGTWGRSMFSSY